MSEREDEFTYVFTSRQESTGAIGAAASPDQVLNLLSMFSKILGYDFESISMMVYVQKGEGTLWQPIHGTKDVTPTLMPLAPLGTEIALTDKEYYDTGKKIINGYEIMKDRLVKLRASIRAQDNTTKKIIEDLIKKTRIIEGTIEGTEMESMFFLKYRNREKHENCAAKLHMGRRTLDRRVHEMITYIGRVLHMTLKPRELTDLMNQQSNGH